MKWSNVKLVLHREVRDQLRDRRTLFTIAVLPVLLYPLLGSSWPTQVASTVVSGPQPALSRLLPRPAPVVKPAAAPRAPQPVLPTERT